MEKYKQIEKANHGDWEFTNKDGVIKLSCDSSEGKETIFLTWEEFDKLREFMNKLFKQL